MLGSSFVAQWLRIWHCHCYGVGTAVVQIRSLAWELPPAVDAEKKVELKFFFFFFFCLFRAVPSAYAFPRLGVESELQLLAYTTATATWDPNTICDLHHSSQQLWILNLLSEARDQTLILTDPSWDSLLLSHEGNSLNSIFF